MPARRFGFLLFCVQLAQARSAACQEARGEAPAGSVCLRSACVGVEHCPGEAELARAVEEVLGRQAFAPSAVGGVAQGEERRAPAEAPAGPICERVFDAQMFASPAGVCRAALHIRSAQGAELGSRELVARTANCAELLGSVALVMALMIESTKAHVSLQVRAPLRAHEQARRAALKPIEVSALAALSFGLLPGFGVGPELRFGTELQRAISAYLEGAAWLPGTSDEATRGRFWAFHAGGSVCTELLRNDQLRCALCAGARAGALTGSGSGLDYNLSSSKPYAQADATLWARFPLGGPLALSAQMGLGAPWIRPRFVYWDASGAAELVHRPSALVVFGGIGLELSAPWRGTQRGSL